MFVYNVSYEVVSQYGSMLFTTVVQAIDSDKATQVVLDIYKNHEVKVLQVQAIASKWHPGCQII